MTFAKIFKRSVTIEEIRSIGQQITPYISEEYELSKEQNDISAELRKYKAYNAIKILNMNIIVMWQELKPLMKKQCREYTH